MTCSLTALRIITNKEYLDENVFSGFKKHICPNLKKESQHFGQTIVLIHNILINIV